MKDRYFWLLLKSLFLLDPNWQTPSFSTDKLTYIFLVEFKALPCFVCENILLDITLKRSYLHFKSPLLVKGLNLTVKDSSVFYLLS